MWLQVQQCGYKSCAACSIEVYAAGVQALNLITEKLAKLHASGWVHRDLKPGNVLRLPSHHSWTLMDFGCAAEQGPPPALKAPKRLPAAPSPQAPLLVQGPPHH